MLGLGPARDVEPDGGTSRGAAQETAVIGLFSSIGSVFGPALAGTGALIAFDQLPASFGEDPALKVAVLVDVAADRGAVPPAPGHESPLKPRNGDAPPPRESTMVAAPAGSCRPCAPVHVPPVFVELPGVRRFKRLPRVAPDVSCNSRTTGRDARYREAARHRLRGQEGGISSTRPGEAERPSRRPTFPRARRSTEHGWCGRRAS